MVVLMFMMFPNLLQEMEMQLEPILEIQLLKLQQELIQNIILPGLQELTINLIAPAQDLVLRKAILLFLILPDLKVILQVATIKVVKEALAVRTAQADLLQAKVAVQEAVVAVAAKVLPQDQVAQEGIDSYKLSFVTL